MSQSPEAVKVWWEARRAWHSRPLTPHENGSVSLGHSEAAASVIEAALQKARDEEMAAVVAWLRNDASTAWGEACDGMEEMSWCIDAIERGEHRREG
jgi:hypothetical protein